MSVISYSLWIQQAATEILEESKRIIAHIANPESPQAIFLEGTA